MGSCISRKAKKDYSRRGDVNTFTKQRHSEHIYGSLCAPLCAHRRTANTEFLPKGTSFMVDGPELDGIGPDGNILVAFNKNEQNIV